MALNLTNFDYALKSLWPQKRVDSLAYKDNPLLAMMKKDEKFGGANRIVAVRYGDSQGRSSVFATAQANVSNHVGTKFTVTRARDYAVVQVDGETVEASKGDANALLEGVDSEMEGGFNTATRSAAISGYGNGSGVIGAVASFTTTAITLTNREDVSNFEKNQVLQASSAGTTGTLRNSGATTTVTAINRDTGVLTCDTTLIAALANADSLNVQGDLGAKMQGLASWVPTSAPSATLFFGVDRSVDTVRLGGVRYDGSALNPEEALYKAAVRIGAEGGRPEYAFMNYTDFGNLEVSLGSKVVFTDIAVGEIGFRGIKINGPRGPINCIPDINCPVTKSWLLQMNTWTLASLGKLPRVLDADGNKMLRQASADGYEIRIGYYGNMYCDAPGRNGVVTLPS